VIAHALTSARLLLVAPVALAFARPDFLDASVLLVLLCVAIATDYWDGRVARVTETASAQGQLFDHSTDFLFVTAALAGAALAGVVTPVLPVLIIIAFGQYVLDSYLLYRQKQLRMSVIGRWNGILYFVPLVVISVSRLGLIRDAASFLTSAAGALGYVLAASTAASILDRAVAPIRNKTT
jgi:phosphatidylglycerophosphate synthase